MMIPDRAADIELLDDCGEGIEVWAVPDGLVVRAIAEAGCVAVEPQLLTWETVGGLRGRIRS